MTIRSTWLVVVPALMAILSGCGSATPAIEPVAQAASGDPAQVVQAAAEAFADAYSQDETLAQFDALFAGPAQSGDQEGLRQTQQAAHSLFDQRKPDGQLQLRSFDITAQQIDRQRGLATVHYRAEISIVEDGSAVLAVLVEQDLALVQHSGSWLIAGGDQPQITRQRP